MNMKKTFAAGCLAALSVSGLRASVNVVTDFGAKTDGTLQSEAFQRAIDAASAKGGDTVVVPPGEYVVAGLFLKDNVTLRLEEGAALIASTNISDYATFRTRMPADYDETKDYPQRNASGSRPSLLRAVVGAYDATNVAIEGKGKIDGRGYVWLSRKRDQSRWRVVLFYRCRNVRVEGVRLENSALWTCYFKECDGVVARGLDIESPWYYENDGIDVEAKNALVEDCKIDSEDDGICLKNDCRTFIVENVEIRNCQVASSCNYIKFGTTSFGGYRNVNIHDCKLVPCRTSPRYSHHLRGNPKGGGYPGVTVPISGLGGISIEAVDGGRISDIRVSNIDMSANCVHTPIFIRMGRRETNLDGKPAVLENILIEKIHGVSCSWIASSITGVPGLRVRNVTIRDVDLTLKSGGTLALAHGPVPEKEKAYPTPNMFDFHILPAYAFYLRHADGIHFENVRVRYAPGGEERPAVVQDDCTDVTFKNCSFMDPKPVERTPDKNGVVWYDGTELAERGLLEGRPFPGGKNFYDRLPADATGRVSRAAYGKALSSSGECLRFRTSSKKIWARWSLNQSIYYYHMAPTGKNGIDFYVQENGEWRYRQWRPKGKYEIRPDDNLTCVDVAPDTPVMIYLPIYNAPKKLEIGVEAGATITPLEPRKSGITKPIVFYGTSITQGACASRAGLAYAAQVCRRLDAPLVNLGFSGSGTLEDGMLYYLARLPASCYVLDCVWNMSEELLKERLEPFVRELRRHWPKTPIVIAQQGDVYGKGRFKAKDDHVKAVYDKLVAEGFTKLAMVPSSEMYAPDGEGSTDGTHPNDYGMKVHADAYEKAIREVLERKEEVGCAPFWSVNGATVPATENIKALPKELWITKAEAEELTRQFDAERKAVGYVFRKPHIFGHGHSFVGWTRNDVWKNHREFFGLTPYGTRGVDMGPGFPSWIKSLSKICVSNEGAVDWRVAEWERAGMPEYVGISENDGVAGYCRCEKCRALDADLPGERFLVNKTDRYVNFWNRILKKMSAKRPDVKGHLFIYSVLRHPPRRERIECPENFLGSYVPTFHESIEQVEAELKAWKAAGLKHFYLRPNYLHNRTMLPFGREKFICDVHHLFRRHGSLGDSFDSCTTTAATKFEIYTALRLCAKPDSTFEEIAAEWYASFGAASGCVRKYYERVRARCDREFPRVVRRLAEKGIEYLDDSHFSRNVHELHTVDELKGDLAVLEEFDGKGLEGKAKQKFEDLKLCARHYVMTLETLLSGSAEDKAKLVAFRAKHKTLFSQNWWTTWNKGEYWLWNDTKEKADYENAAITTWMDDWEQSHGKEIKR